MAKTALDAYAATFFASLDQQSQPSEQAAPTTAEQVVSVLVPTMTLASVRKLMHAIESELQVAGRNATPVTSSMLPAHVCEDCGNADVEKFLVTDLSVVCMGTDGAGCGNVLEASRLYEGNAYRRFEDEEDRSHHGAPPNPLFSVGYNMQTSIDKDGGPAATMLRRVHREVELSCNELGLDSRQTRVGYKDMMKREVFKLIEDVGANLDLPDCVLQLAKVYFARVRDLREQIRNKLGTVAACGLLALPTTRIQEAVPVFACGDCALTFNAQRGLRFHHCPMRSPPPTAATVVHETAVAPAAASPWGAFVFRGEKLLHCCPQCPRIYVTLGDLAAHAARHANQKRKTDARALASNTPWKRSCCV
ncbi:hypothetical protein SPRG_02188 [Saprolegnia parasitica CBS 223.65]|uniref:C2H2-type domain-containing protein n=1 Tax=Saprolegnia parasitica (strain CBS 223.65) TaxID=695850 RepID=A0A067D3R4_SAPPC|nr:hypothetical protein SPRG_02188 [Saprolegnia parasitica CBS 223.65]KDO33381.1 hypothetical protein SPRG_02188 [Saprolegnia parasitica CBS 223.65]|eukprot:XP_012196129.1 hypothetical protein SPRG_02188 [Saprolegnia parasitica CBS 223.65]